MLVGGLIAAVASIGGWIPLIRLGSAKRAHGGDHTTFRIATAQYILWMLLFAAIATAGIGLLTIGGVLGFGFPGWAPLLPGGILVAIALVASYTRWLLMRDRASQSHGEGLLS